MDFLHRGIYAKVVDIDITARVNYLDAKIDRFSEEIVGGSALGYGLALEIDEQDITSLTSTLGVTISKPFSQNFGVSIPYAGLTYIGEHEDGLGNLRARFLNDPLQC